MSAHSTAKEWKRFLTEAGLPKELAGHYAEIFSHHRMRMSMLPDLNKDILFFMGIEVMGDVIAILKHAKQVSVTLGYSKDYESSKLHTSSSKQHKRERTPQYHSSRQYRSSHERKTSVDFDPSPRASRPSKSNQEYSSFQNFSRHEKRNKLSPEMNVTFNNSGRDKFYRESEANESRGSARYQPQNQGYTGSYRDRGVRSRSRSRSPVYSRLHMDESPAKMSVRSRISSRPDQRRQKLSPITFSAQHRATSHASSNKHAIYRNSRNNQSNDYNDYSRREGGRMYADIEERQQQQRQQQQQQKQQPSLTKESFVNELMPSLTIRVDNRGKNKREIQQQDTPKWPRNDSWQHDDRKPRDTVRYDRKQSPAKSNYTQHRSSPKSSETKSRHVSVFNRLT